MISTVDEAQIVIDLLNNHWDRSVIAKPSIQKRSECTHPNVALGDYVLVYRVARTAIPADGFYHLERIRAEVALDVRTDSDTDIKKILSEIRRILFVYRLEAGVYDYLDYAGIDYVDNYRSLYRTVCTVRLEGLTSAS